MGHKQKVRRERQRQQKAKKKNATTPATAAAQAAAAAALLADPSTPTGLLHVDRLLPKSDLYQQGYQLLLGSLGQLLLEKSYVCTWYGQTGEDSLTHLFLSNLKDTKATKGYFPSFIYGHKLQTSLNYLTKL